MSKQADYIAECLVKAYLDGGFNLPTAYENRAFSKPGPDEPWAALFLLPDKPRPVTLGPHGEDEHRGILQVDLHYPEFRHGGHQRQVQRTGVMVHRRTPVHPQRDRGVRPLVRQGARARRRRLVDRPRLDQLVLETAQRSIGTWQTAASIQWHRSRKHPTG